MIDAHFVVMGLGFDARQQPLRLRLEYGHGVVLAGKALDRLQRFEVVDDNELGLIHEIAPQQLDATMTLDGTELRE